MCPAFELMRRSLFVLVGLALFVAACSSPPETTETEPDATTTTTTPPTTTTTLPDFELSSPSWQHGQTIPAENTCDGPDVSPQLDVIGIPADARTLAIIVDDPDAPLGPWDHWVEFDIEVAPGSFQLNKGSAGTLGVSGVNSWNVDGFMGPCPPEGEEHTYVFSIFALDGTLDLPSGVDSDALRRAMTGRIVAQADLAGTYARP